MTLKPYGQRALVFSSRVADDRPKSSLTEASDGPDDSDVDLPRNSHRELRANPCCGSFDVAAWSGAVPKTYK